MFFMIKHAVITTLLLFSYGSNVYCNNKNRNHTKIIDYHLIYKSDVIPYNETSNFSVEPFNTNNLGFSNGMNEFDFINKTHNFSIEECQLVCSKNDNCLGIFQYYEERKEHEETNTTNTTNTTKTTNTTNNINNENNLESISICNYLSQIDEPIFYNITSSSYLKVIHHYYDDDIHNIGGRIYDSFDMLDYPLEESLRNITIYIDENHNGVLDNGEQFILTHNNNRFKFENMTEGTYLIRQIIPDGCYQFYPGLYGDYVDQYIYGDGYVDNIVYYFEVSHTTKILPHGGKIGSGKKIENIDYSYILGNNPSLYFTFYPKNIITLSFADETIINTHGDDIFIDVVEKSNVKAHVYVSHNNINYYNIGVLDNYKTSFDIGESYEKIPVSYIKLEFFVDDYNHKTMYDKIDIISIRGDSNSLYKPAYGYYINIPSYNFDMLFYNDCHYMFSCSMFCSYNTFTDNDYYSCKYGCDVFKNTKDCLCEPREHDNIRYKGTSFNYESCKIGCSLAMKKYVFPDYTVFENSVGYNENELEELNNCSGGCLDNMVDMCMIDNCSSFSLSKSKHTDITTYNNQHGSIYDIPYYKDNINHNLFVKNSFIEIISKSTISTTTTSNTHTSTTTSNTHTSTTTSLTSTTTNNIQSINSNSNNHLYYTIPISVLCGIFLISMIIIVISSYSKNNRRQRNNISYGYANPLYADDNNNNNGVDIIDNEEETDERNNDNYQDVNMNSLNTDLLYPDTHTEYDDYNSHTDTSTTVKYENINPNDDVNYNADYLHVISDNRITTDL